MTLPIALVTSGLAALIGLWLAARVSRIRFAQQVLIGDGDDSRLRQRIRAHGNFTEYTPITLILIALIEWATGSTPWLAIAAAAYLLGRMLHPFGMDGWLPARQAGILLTWGVTLLLALTAIALPFVPRGLVTEGPVAPVEYRG